ncbi:MAG: hypothetical protein ACK56I_10000, partial [bacterium]
MDGRLGRPMGRIDPLGFRSACPIARGDLRSQGDHPRRHSVDRSVTPRQARGAAVRGHGTASPGVDLAAAVGALAS